MIETASIQNWIRWEDKEKRGVNRGYSQAYINEKNAGHRAFLSVHDWSHKPTEYTATTQEAARRSGFTGYDKSSETFDSQEDAESYLCEFMEAHPCARDGDSRDHIELVSDLRTALSEQGLVPQNDADITGWTTAMGSTGFSIRPLAETADGLETTGDPREADVLHVHLNVDGKASGLSYSERTERDSDGETRRFHEPKRPEKLCPKVEAALEAADFENITTVRSSGHQTHWDHDVSYSARTDVPNDLELPAPSRSRRQPSLFR